MKAISPALSHLCARSPWERSTEVGVSLWRSQLWSHNGHTAQGWGLWGRGAQVAVSLQVRDRGCQELMLVLGSGCHGETGRCEPRAQDFGFAYQPFVSTCPSCCGPASISHHLGEGDAMAAGAGMEHKPCIPQLPCSGYRSPQPGLDPHGMPKGSPSIRPHRSRAAEGSKCCWEAPWYGRTIS